jgi:hypothetical protein
MHVACMTMQKSYCVLNICLVALRVLCTCKLVPLMFFAICINLQFWYVWLGGLLSDFKTGLDAQNIMFQLAITPQLVASNPNLTFGFVTFMSYIIFVF